VRINDNAGKTAIQGAAMEGFADILNLLLQESDYVSTRKTIKVAHFFIGQHPGIGHR